MKTLETANLRTYAEGLQLHPFHSVHDTLLAFDSVLETEPSKPEAGQTHVQLCYVPFDHLLRADDFRRWLTALPILTPQDPNFTPLLLDIVYDVLLPKFMRIRAETPFGVSICEMHQPGWTSYGFLDRSLQNLGFKV